jgi:hypothetical protein
MPETGFLEVRIENESNFISNNLPYVVRDSRHGVVHRGLVGDASRTTLPVGLYSVAIVTPRGELASKLLHVEPNETNPVVFDDDVLDDMGVPSAAASDSSTDGAPPPPEAELVSMVGCTLTSKDDGYWTFAPEDNLDAVPTAVFNVGSTVWETSLPLNPAGTEPDLRSCCVSVINDAGTIRVRVSFDPRRRVSCMVDGLVHNHSTVSGATVLKNASDVLLTNKYSDPTGAVLGGLTLHGLGRVEDLEKWVGALDDSAWLPDGQILSAALLKKAPEAADRQRGLDMLLSATTKRPMYTDGLSLAMELLRRWNDDASMGARTERLERLADFSSHADWESVALCVDVTPGT